MSLAPRLDLRQSQSLVMTPQLQQAIKLLALSNLEIETFIADELDKNPLLEAGNTEEVREPEPDGDVAPPEPTDAVTGLNGTDGEAPLDVDYGAETFHHDSPSDMAGGQGMDGALGMDGAASGGSGEGAEIADTLTAAPSLGDHLMAQAGEVLDGRALLIASHIVDALDEAGYLTMPLRDIAERLGVPLYEVETVLAAVQRFDPTGVGARDLAECLTLQAKEADRHDPAMAALLGHLDLLARGDLAKLRRICGVDDEDLGDMIRELRAYDPKPGARFSGGATQSVVPDIFVARTIIKVASEIVKQQEGFFRHGIEHLRPLTLKTVADAIEMHESTVSRVTSNKYLACDRGLFELKFFFTSAIQSADGGEAASAQAVKSHIAKLIAEEAANAILSDDTLVDLLKARGFDIARRTVAKYREALGLGSSVQRRRQKLLAR
jgi:RNA polymerase sigma-54 factor